MKVSGSCWRVRRVKHTVLRGSRRAPEVGDLTFLSFSLSFPFCDSVFNKVREVGRWELRCGECGSSSSDLLERSWLTVGAASERWETVSAVGVVVIEGRESLVAIFHDLGEGVEVAGYH